MNIKNLSISLVTASVILSSCGGGGGGGGNSGDYYTSPYITATQFTAALNSVDGSGYDSQLILGTDLTARSTLPDQDDYFVIWDDKTSNYKAVSLQYIRGLVYFDVYAHDNGTAQEFRYDIANDYSLGNYDGDPFGDDYENVTYNSYDGYFYGDVSGYAYEDEVETHDVNLIASEVEKDHRIELAAKISYSYSVSIESALSLVSLADAVAPMIKRGEQTQELTAEDQAYLKSGIEKLAGVTFEEVQGALLTGDKEEVIKKISSKMGTTPSSLEDKILPELFGISL